MAEPVLTIEKVRDPERPNYVLGWCDHVIIECGKFKMERIIGDFTGSAELWEIYRDRIIYLAKEHLLYTSYDVRDNWEEKPGDNLLYEGVFAVSRNGCDYDEYSGHLVAAHNMFHALLVCIFKADVGDEHPTVWANKAVTVSRVELLYKGAVLSSDFHAG